MRARQRQRGGSRKVSGRTKIMGRTENGELAFHKDNFIQGSTQDSLMAMNFQLVTKSDFTNIMPYFDNILNSNDETNIVLALTSLVYFRDIEEGKGLRNPLIEGLMHIYLKYPKFVHEIIPHIPKYGYYKDLCRLFMEADNMKYEELKQVLTDAYINKLKQEHSKGKIVNCAKFAPREKKKYAKFATAIANQLFPESKTQMRDYRLYLQEIYKHYTQITEVLMCQGRWAEIDPKFVPSICFQRYKKAFLDPKPEKKENEERQKVKERFTTHIKNAVERKDGAKVNAKRLFVNEIIEEMGKYFCQEECSLTEEQKILKLALEAQMMDIIDDTKKNGQLFNENIAIMCDVSGSMNGIPMNVAIGLGLVISEINTHPQFGKRVMTFDSQPQWVCLKEEKSLFDKVQKIQSAPWGMSTDFYIAMELMVQTAQKESDIPKILFVLSDMQFNQADSKAGKQGTGYDRYVSLFKKYGFSQKSIPVIVFWNLRGTDNFVVDSEQEGAICIAGYSQSLLKSIMNAPDVEFLKHMNPFMFIKDVLNSKRYQIIREIALKCIKGQQEQQKEQMELEEPKKKKEDLISNNDEEDQLDIDDY